jgi:hypothetical protein
MLEYVSIMSLFVIVVNVWRQCVMVEIFVPTKASGYLADVGAGPFVDCIIQRNNSPRL